MEQPTSHSSMLDGQSLINNKNKRRKIKMELTITKTKRILKACQEKFKPLYIAGPPGIGKSDLVRQAAEERAEALGLLFIDFNRLASSLKDCLYSNEVYNNNPLWVEFATDSQKTLWLNREKKRRKEAEDAFEKRKKQDEDAEMIKPADLKIKDVIYVFMDVRVSQLDPSDLRGMPSLATNDKPYAPWKPTLMMHVLSQQGLNGTLFFDELSLAPPSVQAAAYQIILDRCCGDLYLSTKVSIMAAGNRAEDKANVFEMSMPLKNRFGHITQIAPTIDEWTDWANRSNIDPRIVAFLNFKPGLLNVPIEKALKQKDSAFPTPRSWAMVSSLIEDIKTNKQQKEEVQMTREFASAFVGVAAASEFIAFIEVMCNLDLDFILNNPKEGVANLNISQLWGLISAIPELYKSNRSLFDKCVLLMVELQPEYAVNMLRMMKATETTLTQWTKRCIKSPLKAKLLSYGMYLKD